jgi:hypothetical protein
VCGVPQALGATSARADFNGDGRSDLAVGVGQEDLGAVADAGAVNVIYGSAAGLTATGNQFWSQESPGIVGGAEMGDNLGTAVAAGDFNGDGKADLGIGAPGESIRTVSGAGAVNVLYGSASGLAATGN